jgi:hypothetical protein
VVHESWHDSDSRGINHMKPSKAASAATRAMLDELRADARPSEDRLETARNMVRKLRDHEMEAAELDARLSEKKQAIREMKEREIPDLLDGIGVPAITLAAEGNNPAYEIAVVDRYHANIPEEERDEAFGYLKKTGNEDLIKTTYTISFGLREGKQAERFGRSLDKAGIEYSVTCAVPWNTLTAWFKAEHKRKPLPAKAMALLGASVGRVAKVVKQKEKK